MYPVLLSLGPFVIYSYGLLIGFGFLIGFFLIHRRIVREYLDEEKVFDALIIAIGLGILGARLFYVIEHFDKFGLVIMNWLLINARPGLSLFGGMGVGLAVFLLKLKKYRLPIYKVLDIVTIPLAVTLSFGHLGAFLGGTLVGLPTKMPWGVVYFTSAKRHPVALYAFLGTVLLIVFINFITKHYKKWKFGEGSTFNSFGVLMSIILFWVAFFKEDDILIAGLFRTEQIVYTTIFIVSSILLYVVNKRSFKEDLRAVTQKLTPFLKAKVKDGQISN